eukprot:63743_1
MAPISKKRHNICLVCDFFYPRMGGVEMHQYCLAQGLIRRGHKVIVVTGTYSGRQGVRYMTNGLKVYYCSQMSMFEQVVFPAAFFTAFPIFRDILIREKIHVVHGHQTTAALSHECIMHARTMGYRCVFTDHSLFGFGDAAAIHANKVMKFTLSDVNHVISVSNTSKENLVLRAHLDPRCVSVIPNAVDSTKFLPDPSRAPDCSERVNVVIVSRLVYRKGIDLAVKVIPKICKRFPNVNFIIGGDGSKRILVEEMREHYQLHDRVEMLGSVPHKDVRDVLVRGHIFLNCSLTEAFCIAILEAACCGLFVVSTRVGGVPEVLPDGLIRLADPTVDDVTEALAEAISNVRTYDAIAMHERICRVYSWHDVAARTERVYDRVTAMPNEPFVVRLRRFYDCGSWAGPLFCMMIAIDYILWRCVEWLVPRKYIDQAPDWPNEMTTASDMLLFSRANGDDRSKS